MIMIALRVHQASQIVLNADHNMVLILTTGVFVTDAHGMSQIV